MLSSLPENLEMLLEVSRLLSSKLNLPELLRAILELGARIVNAETASLLLVDVKTQELYFDIALGMDPDLARVRLKVGQGIAGSVAQNNRSVIIPDVREDPRWSAGMDQQSGFMTRSILAAPLSLKGRCIGVVEAINKLDGTFSDADLRAFEAFASQAAVAIENARLFSSLIEETTKLNTILNEMHDAVILTDAAGKILLANQAVKQFLPQADSGHGTLAQAIAGLELVPDLRHLLDPKAPLVRFEATRSNPKKLVLAGTASEVDSGETDAPARRVIVFRDVTEEKHEEGLKRTFLSLISHKLKTPLASITGYSQLLLEEHKGKSAADFLTKSLTTINGQGLKLAALVEKLLNYTMLEQLDVSEFQLTDIDVDPLLQETVQSMDAWLNEHRGRVLLEAGSGLRVRGEASLLRDVVKNLIENGVKFDTHSQRKVAVWATPNDGRVEIHVRDSGPGIPPEESEKIFRRFYQVEPSFTGQVEGWGLGLSFVQKVIGRLDGSVRLESSLGAGSTFTVSLPASKQ